MSLAVPRDEAGEPHSPVLLPFGGDFASFKHLFGSHSLPFASHSPAFEPSEVEGTERELPFEWREELFLRHSLLFAWHSLPLASLEGLFASHSPELESREEQGMPSEAGGMPREKFFGWRSLRFAWHSPRGMGSDLSFARLEDRGMPREEWGTRPFELFVRRSPDFA